MTKECEQGHSGDLLFASKALKEAPDDRRSSMIILYLSSDCLEKINNTISILKNEKVVKTGRQPYENAFPMVTTDITNHDIPESHDYMQRC